MRLEALEAGQALRLMKTEVVLKSGIDCKGTLKMNSLMKTEVVLKLKSFRILHIFFISLMKTEVVLKLTQRVY